MERVGLARSAVLILFPRIVQKNNSNGTMYEFFGFRATF